MRKVKKTRLIFFILLSFLVFTGCRRPSGNQVINKSKLEDTATKKNIILQIDDGNDKISFILDDVKAGEKLWPVMQRKLDQENVNLKFQNYGSGLGVLVTQINDKKNGKNGKYWQYFVNGKYAQVGASNYVLQIGDVVEWIFTNETL